MKKDKETSLEDEYIFELDKEFDYENDEVYELLKNAERYTERFEMKVEYVINHSKNKNCTRKAIELIIEKEIKENNNISINLIDLYLNLLEDNDLKIQKLKEFENEDYIYKELFSSKIAEVEIDKIEQNMTSIDQVNEKLDYIHAKLEVAEGLAKKNRIKLYISFIYEQMGRIYEIEGGENNKCKSEEYKEKAERIKKEADYYGELEVVKSGINKFKKGFGRALEKKIKILKSPEFYDDIKNKSSEFYDDIKNKIDDYNKK